MVGGVGRRYAWLIKCLRENAYNDSQYQEPYNTVIALAKAGKSKTVRQDLQLHSSFTVKDLVKCWAAP